MRYSKTVSIALLTISLASLVSALPLYAQTESQADTLLYSFRSLVTSARLSVFDSNLLAAKKALSKRFDARNIARRRWLSAMDAAFLGDGNFHEMTTALKEAWEASRIDIAPAMAALETALREASGNKAFNAFAGDAYSSGISSFALEPDLVAMLPDWNAFQKAHPKPSDHSALLACVLTGDAYVVLQYLAAAEPKSVLSLTWNKAQLCAAKLVHIPVFLYDAVGTAKAEQLSMFRELTSYLKDSGQAGYSILKQMYGSLDPVGLLESSFVGLSVDEQSLWCRRRAVSRSELRLFLDAVGGTQSYGISVAPHAKALVASEQTEKLYMRWRAAVLSASGSSLTLALELSEQQDVQFLFSQSGIGFSKREEYIQALSEAWASGFELSRSELSTDLSRWMATSAAGAWNMAKIASVQAELTKLSHTPFCALIMASIPGGALYAPASAYSDKTIAKLSASLSGRFQSLYIVSGLPDASFYYVPVLPEALPGGLTGLELLCKELKFRYKLSGGVSSTEEWLLGLAPQPATVWALHELLRRTATGPVAMKTMVTKPRAQDQSP